MSRRRARAWLLLLLPPLAAVASLPVITERQPLVSRSASLAASSLVDARRLLASNDPGRLRRAGERTALIPAGLVDIAIDQLANRRLGGHAAFVIVGRSGELRLSIPLHGRQDSAQHFVVSAALAAWAGEWAADVIGLDKEMRDARSGSGFSFADLAADRAGSRFGELVAADSPRLRAVLQRPLSDGDLAPSLAGLPEGLSVAEFERCFAVPESADYRQLITEIERRLDEMPLYR